VSPQHEVSVRLPPNSSVQGLTSAFDMNPLDWGRHHDRATAGKFRHAGTGVLA
jgi:hypothetical protein